MQGNNNPFGINCLIFNIISCKGHHHSPCFCSNNCNCASPCCNVPGELKINRVVAIVITILLTFLVIVAFGALLISQISRFSDSWPSLVEKFTSISSHAITWLSDNFDINPHKISDWIAKTQGDLITFSTGAIGKTLVVLGSALVVIFLLPVYIFLILIL